MASEAAARPRRALLSAVGWRRLLHATLAGTTLLLLGSGFLLGDPDLRARLLGGYGREIAEVHEIAGALFVLVPLLALSTAGRPLARDARRRLAPPDPLSWRKLHLVLSLVATPLLGVTGLVLWWDAAAPLLAVVDLALGLHAALAWGFLAMLAIHLVAARRKLASRLRDLRGRRGRGDPSGDPLETSE